MTVAIIKDDFFGKHSASWSAEWLAACKAAGLAHELVDWRAHNALDRLLRHRQILWHFSHYSAAEMQFARSLLYALEHAGCRVFPGFQDSWHFDDKIAQAFLLRAIGAPIPRNFTFFAPSDLEDWLRSGPAFPIVGKLRAGSGSNNVRLLRTPDELRAYAAQMFGRGLRSAPNPLFKISSNLRSSRSFADILRRARRAPEFLFSLSQARALPREQGYVYLQEFVPGATYDIKVVVVRDKLSFIGRNIRKGDFRASGGGNLFYDKAIMNDSVIKAAFRVSDALKSECVGMDFVVNPESGAPLIVEISYGFSHTALLAAGGYYDRSGNWQAVPLNAPRDVLRNLCERTGIGAP